MGGWDGERRVVAKAEHIDSKENPRFVVTSLPAERWAPQALYEELYCARGEMENRIQEQFSLFADRVPRRSSRALSGAQAKARSKRTADHRPVQSFPHWLKDLATIVKNRVQPCLASLPAFEVITRPTPSQHYALELLHVKL